MRPIYRFAGLVLLGPVLGVLSVALSCGVSHAQQPPSEAEQLRARLVEVLAGPLCAGKLTSGVSRYATVADARNCDVAVRDAMAGLVLIPPGPVEPPPAGTAAEVTCRITIGELAPPQCGVILPPAP